MPPLTVTQPHLPPLEEFIPYLEAIWDRRVLTNGGPMHQQLEAALCAYLGVPHISLFANGTAALLTAVQALELSGEVITTPFSFVAGAHALLWNGLTPVFADIDPETLNLDPARIEAAVTERTTGIMPVHCYGNPCDLAAIERIARARGLRVLYDAAHAFGVTVPDGSVLTAGDLSVLSFHATKVFNTFEGGAIVSHDAATKQRIDQLKNFGIVDETTVDAAGLNGKMSEVNAAFGLVQLQHIDAAIARRAQIDAHYRALLAEVPGITCVPPSGQTRSNHSYFPILVGSEYPVSRNALYTALKGQDILSRRYFHPLISHFPMYRALPSAAPRNLPVATRVAEQVLCLPIHTGMCDADVERVVTIVREGAACAAHS
ncbi:MAG: DegT/DnrJ/EryC1/StrS family aminotransferase [Gemmatimonadaceae bacterium]|jgi:dTDP-4-amino-4,6-dideoxygalactose transaminase|nr:DegT/DnrJ/EryC1/StrS family aminotransferase [Gemmatimonadaceae bacterium]